MKNTNSTLLIIGTFIIAAGVILALQLSAHKQPPPSLTSLANGRKMITNAQYHFSVTIPKEMSINEYPLQGPALFTLIFKRPNLNTNEGKTRDTIDGFNTASDDSAFFSVYEKPALWDKSNLDTFMSWFQKNIQPNRQLVKVDLRTQGNLPLFITSESDGVAGSVGRYEYLIGKQYIYTLSSDDLTNKELEAILATVKVG